MSAFIPTIEGVPATHLAPPQRPSLDERQRRFEAVDRDMEQAQAKRAKPSIELVRASQLSPEPISWLWPGWLPLGKLVLLAGAPGTGKTTAALSFAATVTAGGSFPDGSLCPVGDVLIWSGEDDSTDTLAPRLIAAGANQDRIYFVGNVDPHGERRPFDPATDTAKLLEAAQGLPDLRLVIFDPVVNAITGNSHQNTEVRRGLQPLVDFAARVGAVLVGITHLAKGGAGLDPTMRVIGSVAFSAVARVVLVCGKNQDDGGNQRRILVRSKSNLGPDDGGFTYSLEQVEALPGITASRTVWGEAVEGSARELLAEPETGQDELSAMDAASLLREELSADCWTNAKEVQRSVASQGFSPKQIWAASKRLHVIRKRGGYQGNIYWRLPGGPKLGHQPHP
jgi:putative DNA primase/helicase